MTGVMEPDGLMEAAGPAEPDERAEPGGLMDAFWDYERALMANDLEALDRLFAPGPTTLRGDAAGLLVGHEAISSFRGGRGGAPARWIVETHVQAMGADHGLVVAVTELERGGRGQQTQLWARTPTGWVVTAAHVSVPPPALDTRIWRVIGTPLVTGAAVGPLAGQSVAVKDLFGVAGQRVGAGNPAWLAAAPVEASHAWAVECLLAAGADVTGLAQTDEFAYSLAGTNAHHGSPPNPRAPHRLSGGSTSGPASAVSLGHATIGLGTDTGGSIRVPAAYHGLYGIRTSRGSVPSEGLLPLSPSFDTTGWLTRDAELLSRVGEVLLPASPGGSDDLVVVPELVSIAEPEVAVRVRDWAAALGAAREHWDLGRHTKWLEAFLTRQAWEAWRERGPWLADRLDTLGPDVRARFEYAATIGPDAAAAAAEVVARARTEIRDLVGDRILVLPSASSVAPRFGADLQPVRSATMLLTCLAGLGGLPAVSVPLTTTDGLPCGASLVAGRGRDLDLLRLAALLQK
jgi:amidase